MAYEAPVVLNAPKGGSNLPIQYDPEFAARQLFGKNIKPYSLSNAEARELYDSRVKLMNIDLPATRTNAKLINAQRNYMKKVARDLMSNRKAAAWLDENRPIQYLDYYIKKYSKEGYSGEALWRRIMEGGKSPNKGISRKYGVTD